MKRCASGSQKLKRRLLKEAAAQSGQQTLPFVRKKGSGSETVVDALDRHASGDESQLQGPRPAVERPGHSVETPLRGSAPSTSGTAVADDIGDIGNCSNTDMEVNCDEHASDLDVGSDDDVNTSVSIDVTRSTQIRSPASSSSASIVETQRIEEACVGAESASPPLFTKESYFRSDKSIYGERKVFAANRKFLMRSASCQPRESDLPQKKFPDNQDGRRFSSSFYHQKNCLGETAHVPWLAYSPRGDYAYCHYCWLFGSAEIQKTKMVTGFSDWNHLTFLIRRHERNSEHQKAIAGFIKHQKMLGIDHQIDKALGKRIEDWQEVLKIQFGLLQKLTSCSVPIRGHRDTVQLEETEGDGVYFTLLKFIANNLSPTLKRHLESNYRIKYFSKDIIMEQVQVLAELTRSKLLDDIRSAKFFALLADGTTDISHHDQLAIVIRYVDVSGKMSKIRESFLGYVRVTDATAAGHLDVLWKTVFEIWNLDPSFLAAQGYDGAAVMSGAAGGLQRLMRDKLGEGVFAPYVHCQAHCLNLVVVHAAEKQASLPTVNFFGTTEALFTFFADSNRRWDVLECVELASAVSDDSDDEHESVDDPSNLEDAQVPLGRGGDVSQPDQGPKPSGSSLKHPTSKLSKPLRKMCTTRWSAKIGAIRAVRDNLAKVLAALEKLVNDRHDANEVFKASSLLRALNFEYAVCLEIWYMILTPLCTLSEMLQKVDSNLLVCKQHMEATLATLKGYRSDEQYQSVLSRARSLLCAAGFDPSETNFTRRRDRRPKRMPDEGARSNEPTLRAAEKFKVDVYYSALDNVIAELTERARGHEEIQQVFGFLEPSALKEASEERLQAWCKDVRQKFPARFSENLFCEVVGFRALYQESFSSESFASSNTVQQYLDYICSNDLRAVFPELEILIRMFLTIPVSTASDERSFSFLRRIKTYSRSNMLDETLTAFAILAIERDTAANLSFDSVIQAMASKKARRGVAI
jgi:hypothetical protein